MLCKLKSNARKEMLNESLANNSICLTSPA